MSTATRTYRGRAVDELIPQIQRELGNEAIIVRRREGLTGGFLGFFQHPYVEIEAMPGTAGIDIYDEEQALPPSFSEPRRPVAPPLAPPPPAPRSAAPSAGVSPPGVSTPPPSPSSFAPAARAYQQPPPPPPSYQPPVSRPEQMAGGAYVTAHLAALARARPLPPIPERRAPVAPPSVDFHELIPRELSHGGFTETPMGAVREQLESPQARPAPRTFERRTVAPGSQSRARAGVEKSLRRFGVSEELAGQLIDSASAHVLPLAPRLGLAQAVRITLAQRIPVAPALPTRGAAIVVIGAGGSGKTTCCAALLGAYRTSSTLPAAFATITRPAEHGELEMILTPHVMKPTPANAPRALRALRRARGEGIAIVDTPRLSPSDRSGIRELARLLNELEPERIVIALPATLGAAAAAQLLEALAPVGANALAFTHSDETDQIGVAVEAACKFDLAPEFMLERARAGGWRLSRIDPTGLAGKLLQ
jgi:flagellar biosynthesis GTPase FlhF